jgi:superfamily II DNA/RNA helicase
MTPRHTFTGLGALLEKLCYTFKHFLADLSFTSSRIRRTGRAGKKGFAVSFFVAEKNGRMARDIIEILNRTSQNVPQELVQASMSSFGAKRGGRGRGGGRGRY